MKHRIRETVEKTECIVCGAEKQRFARTHTKTVGYDDYGEVVESTTEWLEGFFLKGAAVSPSKCPGNAVSLNTVGLKNAR